MVSPSETQPKIFDIPRTTLQARRSGASLANASHHQQRLSPEQENILSDWIIDQEASGYAPSHARVREIATLMLGISGDTKPPGKIWVNTFIKRNSRVASVMGKPIESARIRGAQRGENCRILIPSENNIIFNNEISGICMSMASL
jgi:hypothetical protein